MRRQHYPVTSGLTQDVGRQQVCNCAEGREVGSPCVMELVDGRDSGSVSQPRVTTVIWRVEALFSLSIRPCYLL